MEEVFEEARHPGDSPGDFVVTRVRGSAIQKGREALYGSGLEESGKAELSAKSLFGLGDNAHREHRVAPEIEELVLNSDGLDAQNIFPDVHQLSLGGVLRRHIAAIQTWPGT